MIIKECETGDTSKSGQIYCISSKLPRLRELNLSIAFSITVQLRVAPLKSVCYRSSVGNVERKYLGRSAWNL
jgi:hypothetical protein